MNWVERWRYRRAVRRAFAPLKDIMKVNAQAADLRRSAVFGGDER